MRSTIYFDGKSSADFGLIVEYFPESVHAARRGELITIPGRNGVIVREDGAFDTYSQQYQVWFRNTMGRDTYQKARDVAEWLLSASGFCRLEDTYEPEHFRLARFVGPLSVETVLRNHGRATLEFDVQPQRYLKSGETPIRFESESEGAFTITNPTQFEARPLMKFVDTVGRPEPIAQTFGGVNYDTRIAENGEIYGEHIEGEEPSQNEYTTYPVTVTGYDYAIITADAYVFKDANNDPIVVAYGTFNRERLVIPSNAATIILGVMSEPREGLASLWLQPPPQSTGVILTTINGTSISLDFSTHDTIFLDCDLHDAYYIDGSNANSAVTFTNKLSAYPTFPGLVPGNNSIVVGNRYGVDLEIVPRWWTL